MSLDSSQLWTGGTGAFAAVLIGLIAARVRIAMQRTPGRWLDGMMLLLLAVPPTMLKVGAIHPLSFRLAVESLALAVSAAPFMYFCASASFSRIERASLEAARVFGLSEWAMLRHVVAPAGKIGIAAGLILVLLRAIVSALHLMA